MSAPTRPENLYRRVEFMISAFTDRELRRLAVELDPELAADLPGPAAPLVDVAEDLLERVEMRGITDDLRRALLQARPARAAEIRAAYGDADKRPPSGRERVFISYAHSDTAIARAIAREFQARGAETFNAEDIESGTLWERRTEEELRQATIVVLVVTPAFNTSLWAQREMEVAVYRAGAAGVRIVPVIDQAADLPPALMRFASLRLGAEPIPRMVERILVHPRPADADPRPPATLSFREPSWWSQVAAWFLRLSRRIDVSERAPPPPDVVSDPLSPLTRISRDFFTAAGRTPAFTPPDTLRIPEPVLVSEAVPTAADLDAFGLIHLDKEPRGFLVHRDVLSDSVVRALDELRVRGFPIVALSEWLMRSALTDNRAGPLLETLIQQQVGVANFFRAGNATLDRRYLFGRGAMLATIGQMLRAGEHVLLTGSRKSGKTSFLNILRQDLTDRPVASFDLQNIDPRSSSWPEQVFASLIDAYDRWGRTTWPDWPLTRADGAAIDLPRALEDRQATHEARRGLKPMVVILDELERVFPRAGQDPSAWIRFSGALRALGQGGDRALSIIAADLRPVANRENLLGAETNPFFKFFQEAPIAPLDADAVDDMLRTLARRMGVLRVEPGFVQAVHTRSGGHPWVTRTIAAAAADRAARKDTLTAADVEAGLDDLHDRDELGNFFRMNFVGPLTPQERAYLLDICAGATPSGDGDVRASLRAQQLVIHGAVPIGAFQEWVRSELIPPRAAK